MCWYFYAMLRQERISFTCTGRDQRLEFTLIESGMFPVVGDQSFIHAMPGFNRLFHFQRGEAEVRIGERCQRLVAGPIYLLPAGRSFHITYRHRARFRFHHVRFTDEHGLEVLAALPSIPELDDRALATAGDGDGLVAAAALLTACLRFHAPIAAQGGATTRRAVRHAALLRRIRDQVDAATSVASLARGGGITADALAKSFIRDVGIPLKRYLLQALMARAERLLAESDLSAAEIAVELGFDDPAYFGRAFRRIMHQSPLAYRRAVRLGLDAAVGRHD